MQKGAASDVDDSRRRVEVTFLHLVVLAGHGLEVGSEGLRSLEVLLKLEPFLDVFLLQCPPLRLLPLALWL